MKKFIPIFILFLAFSNFAQKKPKAVLVDEFTNPNCEMMSARMDNFAIQISNNPESKSVVVIAGEENNLRKNLFYEGTVKEYFKKRGLTSNQLHIIRTSYRDNVTFNFWIVPPGAEMPSLKEITWSFEVAKSSKPYMFYWEYSFDEDSDICPAVDGTKLLADVLKANPTAHTNVVIRKPSRAAFYKKRRKVELDLIKRCSIQKNQVKMFYALKSKHRRLSTIEPEIEYWIVP